MDVSDSRLFEFHFCQSTSNSFPWSKANDRLSEGTTPPPSKRTRTDSRCSPSPAPSTPLNGGLDLMRESLLGQALEGGPTLHSGTHHKGNSDSSLQAHSTGEESNSSDTNLSDRGPAEMPHLKSEPSDYSPNDEHTPHNMSNHLDPSRTPSFPAALLGLQGLPGLLPGPSGIHASQDPNFGERLPKKEISRHHGDSYVFHYKFVLRNVLSHANPPARENSRATTRPVVPRYPMVPISKNPQYPEETFPLRANFACLIAK
ncbi:hypothetical protein RUM44_007066 [Polyplax serrata]|uniref:Uncharacterized protein n=1 Tax=Polyplax serrata TaxID=468196 RepID=A0ABR1AZM7_POLSC